MQYKATCPICGWSLMKATPNSEIHIDCPKCKNHLWIVIEEKGVRIQTCDSKKTTA